VGLLGREALGPAGAPHVDQRLAEEPLPGPGWDGWMAGWLAEWRVCVGGRGWRCGPAACGGNNGAPAPLLVQSTAFLAAEGCDPPPKHPATGGLWGDSPAPPGPGPSGRTASTTSWMSFSAAAIARQFALAPPMGMAQPQGRQHQGRVPPADARDEDSATTSGPTGPDLQPDGGISQPTQSQKKTPNNQCP